MLIAVIQNVMQAVAGSLSYTGTLDIGGETLKLSLSFDISVHNGFIMGFDNSVKQTCFISETYIDRVSTCAGVFRYGTQRSVLEAFLEKFCFRTFYQLVVYALYLLCHNFTTNHNSVS